MHGFSFFVGEEAFVVGDCERASMFLRHLLARVEARAQELVPVARCGFRSGGTQVHRIVEVGDMQ